MKKIIFIFLSLSLLIGCNENQRPSTTYTGYFKILLRNEIAEKHGENSPVDYKHFFVQGIKDSFLFCDISQHDYPMLTDSLYYVKKVGDVIKFDSIKKDDFIHGEKAFIMAKQ